MAQSAWRRRTPIKRNTDDVPSPSERRVAPAAKRQSQTPMPRQQHTVPRTSDKPRLAVRHIKQLRMEIHGLDPTLA